MLHNMFDRFLYFEPQIWQGEAHPWMSGLDGHGPDGEDDFGDDWGLH